MARKKYSYEEVKKFIEVESGSGCKLLSKEYKGAHDKLKLMCECGDIFEVNWNKFKNRDKRQCNECGRKNIGRKLRIDKNIIKSNLNKKGYKLLSEYKNNRKAIVLEDKKGYKYYSSFSNIHSGKTPYKFSKFNPHTIENIKLWLRRQNLNYKILSDKFKNSSTKLKWQCDEEHIFYMNWNNFYTGQRCPYCEGSSGEIEIQRFLTNNNINFKKEYWFEDCRGNSDPLRFDFVIFKNNKINLLIEYDGKQHYKPINFGGISDDEALINYKRTKKYDNIKNQYCLKNNIPLLRIPYWDFHNIENILDKALTNKCSAYFIA